MSKFALIRDVVHDKMWYAYTPVAGNSNDYFVTFLMVPVSEDGYITSQYQMYGTLRKGRVGSALDGEFITTSLGTGSQMNYTYHTLSIGADNVKFTVPAKHDRVTVLIYSLAGGGSCSVDWDDGGTQGIDNLTIEGDAGAGNFLERILTLNADNGVDRDIRLTSDADGGFRIIGFRSWDTTSIGDITTTFGSDTTLGSNGAFKGSHEGHSIVTIFEDTATFSLAECEAVAGQSYRLGDRESTLDFVVGQGPNSGTAKSVGGTFHFLAADYRYRYHSGEFSNGPDIIVDGIAADNIWDDANNPVRTMFAGGNGIKILSTGFSDWDQTGTENPDATDLDYGFGISDSGFNVNISLSYRSDTKTGIVYLGQLDFTTGVNATFLFEDGTSTPVVETITQLKGNRIQIRFDDFGGVMEFATDVQIQDFFMVGWKLYQRAAREMFAGGVNPQDGDVWLLSARWHFIDPALAFDQVPSGGTERRNRY